jgi:hypothetical protein
VPKADSTCPLTPFHNHYRKLRNFRVDHSEWRSGNTDAFAWSLMLTCALIGPPSLQRL